MRRSFSRSASPPSRSPAARPDRAATPGAPEVPWENSTTEVLTPLSPPPRRRRCPDAGAVPRRTGHEPRSTGLAARGHSTVCRTKAVIAALARLLPARRRAGLLVPPPRSCAGTASSSPTARQPRTAAAVGPRTDHRATPDQAAPPPPSPGVSHPRPCSRPAGRHSCGTWRIYRRASSRRARRGRQSPHRSWPFPGNVRSR